VIYAAQVPDQLALLGADSRSDAVEHEPDDLGFDRIDDDSLLGAVAAFLDLLKGEAEW
jgi:hypothetical protein